MVILVNLCVNRHKDGPDPVGSDSIIQLESYPAQGVGENDYFRDALAMLRVKTKQNKITTTTLKTDI